MVVKKAVPCLGFDVDQVLSFSQAQLFKANGYDFCIRYIPRQLDNFLYNLTNAEMLRLLQAGLSLMVVQHVSPNNWSPTAALGKQYGQYAALYCEKTLLLPKGVCVWLDLEMVAEGTAAGEVVDYCHAWFGAVTTAGYIPGLYVGFGPVLGPEALYISLPFKHYWRAYNGPEVAIRGFQLIQHPPRILDGIAFDPNQSQPDELGDTVIWLSPD